MSRLDDLYTAIETMRREHLSTADLEAKVSLAEEETIKNEILPVLKQNIEPALQPVKRELVLVVDYVPGKPLSVHLSRKRNFAAEIPDAKEIVIDPEVSHSKHFRIETQTQRGPATDLSVRFPDGVIIAEKKAADTFEKAIKKIGVDRVRQVVEQLNLKFCKVPVISNRRDEKYGGSQRSLGGGWLLITHSNNKMKKQFLDKVSKQLGVGLVVDIID